MRDKKKNKNLGVTLLYWSVQGADLQTELRLPT